MKLLELARLWKENKINKEDFKEYSRKIEIKSPIWPKDETEEGIFYESFDTVHDLVFCNLLELNEADEKLYCKFVKEFKEARNEKIF